MISHAANCDAHPSSVASRQVRARESAMKSGTSAMKMSQEIAAFGNASAKRTPDVTARARRNGTRQFIPREARDHGSHRALLSLGATRAGGSADPALRAG